jgi:hypothetical protein
MNIQKNEPHGNGIYDITLCYFKLTYIILNYILNYYKLL